MHTASPPTAALAQADDIVETKRMRDTAQQVEAALPPPTIDQPWACFTDPICPGVVRMVRKPAQAVVDRIGIVADMPDLSVDAPGCDPNLPMIATADGRGLARRMKARRTGNLRVETGADMHRIFAEPDRNCPVDGPLEVRGSSQIVSAAHRNIFGAIVVNDHEALAARQPVRN